MFKIISILKLIRFMNLLIAFGVVNITFFILDEPISYLTLHAIIIILSTMSIGYILNDIIDIPNDLVNKKKQFNC